MSGRATHRAGARFAIHPPRPFADSAIWDAQAAYYATRGIEAWRSGEVPHYVTCNPTIASAYAAIALAFHQDATQLGILPVGERLLVCELGAGSGRFAFHFLARLAELCEDGDIAKHSFLYVMTDAAQTNLDYWRGHPRLRPLFAAGLLDMALFDVTRPGALDLQVSGRRIGAGDLKAPIVSIANYVFDSVAADLFQFRKGRSALCLMSLSAGEDLSAASPAEFLAKVQPTYAYAPVAEAPYPEPVLRRLFDEYRLGLHDTLLLFPAPALRCLKSLSALSTRGLLALSADKGDHRIEALDGRGPPPIERHGAVSLPVNYHAFARFCEEEGGVALLPSRDPASIHVVGLMMLAEAGRCARTSGAYRRHVDGFGPDDFRTVARHVRSAYQTMSAPELLAYLRLCRRDDVQLGRMLPRLTDLADKLDTAGRGELRAEIEAVWSRYYPIGEQPDLAHGIAGLLYAMGDYAGALDYYRHSIELYGRGSGTLYNMACCHHMLGREAEAAAALRDTLRHDPDNQAARALLARCGTMT